jgi:cytochrome oxidase Cu insertion factor (SCO1/SenC/PrrC family)
MRAKIAVSFLLLTIVFALGADPVVGKEKAQNFTLVDINGKQFSLSDHLGKVVLLDFFTTMCPPCIIEIEHLKGLYNKYSPDQLVILSISVDPYTDTVQRLQSFAQQNEITWTVARDTANVAYKYGVSPIPHLVIVDAEGYKRHNHIGLTAESTFRSEIDSLLSEIGNGDSNGNPDTKQTEPSYTLIAAIGVGVIIFLIVGIIVARKRLGQSKRAKKRRSRKRKR